MAIVGESGSGKSVGVLSIMGLIPIPPGKIEAGSVLFNGRDLLQISDEEVRHVRGNEIAMIFQDPMTSLNPVLTIGQQMTESMELHLGMNREQANHRAAEMMTLVGIPNALDRLDDYPHQFSGGQRQRIGIAMALTCNPSLLIADEPTTRAYRHGQLGSFSRGCGAGRRGPASCRVGGKLGVVAASVPAAENSRKLAPMLSIRVTSSEIVRNFRSSSSSCPIAFCNENNHILIAVSGLRSSWATLAASFPATQLLGIHQLVTRPFQSSARRPRPTSGPSGTCRPIAVHPRSFQQQLPRHRRACREYPQPNSLSGGQTRSNMRRRIIPSVSVMAAQTNTIEV